MKSNILKIAFLIAIIITIAISCTDDFVERDPVYAITSENYFNSKEDYQNALVGAYDLLQSTYLNSLLGEIASDNTLSGGESANDVVGFQQVDEMTHTPVNSNLRDLWNWMFAGVSRCNYILEFKDKTDFQGKSQLIAETRFLKAYYEFELVKWFGAIPLSGDKRFKLEDETKIPRSPVADVYASIEAELVFAIDNLSPTTAIKGTVTKGAAQALLGKVYLYQEKYIQAAAILEQVINSNNYSLVTNFGDIFENAGENGLESVFEVQYTEAEGAGFGCLQCSEGNVAVGFSGVRNYNGPLFTSGFSFNIPTQEASNAFEAGDKRKDATILDIVTFAAANSATYGIGYKHTGFFNRKYLPRTRVAPTGDANLTNPNNYRAIRYADVLLMAAEANNRGGIDDAKARTFTNLVRRRAFGDLLHDVPSLTTGSALTDVILSERRVELMGEGHRFFDLVRTGKAVGKITGFTANKNEIFPVPFEEIQFASGNWQQNRGY
jgi:starch-binding outer membrane protein, SusD/RagB family